MRLLALFCFCLLGMISAFQSITYVPRTKSPSVGIARRPLPLQPLNEASQAGDNDEKLVSTLPGWDPTNWTPKRLWNTPLFRSAAILTALGCAGLSSTSPVAKISSSVGAAIHLFSFAMWFGTMGYTTFVLGITAFKNLPRQTFGKLQSKLFPKYFNLCAVSIVLQVLTLKNLPDLGKRASVALGTALAMTLLNLFYLEPKSTKIMFDRYDRENEPGGKDTDEYKKLAAEFGKFHGISSLTNLVALCGAVAHGWYLSSALVV